MRSWAWGTTYTYIAPSQDHSSLCEKAALQVEMFYGIPEHLLWAIALVETGIYIPKKNASHTINVKRLPSPWPWALQVGGKSFYFANKADAVRAAHELLARNIRNFDVGCMQINMLYHSGAFRSVSDALEPILNTGYAGEHLLALKKASGGSWDKAIAYYHSRTPWRGEAYLTRVQNALLKSSSLLQNNT